ncbi:hypothetical protein [Dongia sp.]|uniref:hypothetical protein n=1 Tax=Dongia sp. TaxID=1977262 RepID=UPI003753A133
MKSILLATALGIAWASLTLWMAFENNNQGELFETQSGAIVWRSVLAFFLGQFIAIFVAVCALSAMLQAAWHKLGRLGVKPKS